jgi:hypothetical protein
MQNLLFVLAVMITLNGFAQSQFQVTKEGSDKIMKGIITRRDISEDTAFKWYKANQAGYTPNAAAVQALKLKGENIQLIAFGGTWCDDTKVILPKFFSLTDAAGFPDTRLTLVGVDRSKKTISHLAEALGVINVPTIIVLKDGKELGRVVEYGNTGQWDKELGEIVNTAQ